MGRIAAAARILAGRNGSWSFGEVYRKAAYKPLPIKPDDSRYEVISLWGPSRSIWCGFRTRTHLFGPAAAVLRYNVLSRIIASLLRLLLAIPTMWYFGDFGFPTRPAGATETMAAPVECLSIYALTPKVGKSDIWTFNTSLGLAA